MVHPHVSSILFKIDCSNAICSLGDIPVCPGRHGSLCRFFCIVLVLCTEILAHDDDDTVVLLLLLLLLLLAAVRLVTVTNNFDATDDCLSFEIDRSFNVLYYTIVKNNTPIIALTKLWSRMFLRLLGCFMIKEEAMIC